MSHTDSTQHRASSVAGLDSLKAGARLYAAHRIVDARGVTQAAVDWEERRGNATLFDADERREVQLAFRAGAAWALAQGGR